jgi:hypothetical protein
LVRLSEDSDGSPIAKFAKGPIDQLFQVRIGFQFALNTLKLTLKRLDNKELNIKLTAVNKHLTIK